MLCSLISIAITFMIGFGAVAFFVIAGRKAWREMSDKERDDLRKRYNLKV